MHSIPWDLVDIKVMTVEVNHQHDKGKSIVKFLREKGYKMVLFKGGQDMFFVKQGVS